MFWAQSFSKQLLYHQCSPIAVELTAIAAMVVHRLITAMVVPVAQAPVGVIQIEEGVEAGAIGDPIHPHGSDILNGSPRY